MIFKNIDIFGKVYLEEIIEKIIFWLFFFVFIVLEICKSKDFIWKKEKLWVILFKWNVILLERIFFFFKVW